MTFLSKDDFRRKNNIQPFPRLVVCPSKEFDFEKAVPLETRIIRKGRKRNSFIIFGLLPKDVLFSCQEEYNKGIFLDRTFGPFSEWINFLMFALQLEVLQIHGVDAVAKKYGQMASIYVMYVICIINLD